MTKRDGLTLDVSERAQAERLERLIASNEHAANALNRVAQLLESRETKRVLQKAKRGRLHPAPLAKVQCSPEIEQAAREAFARLNGRR